MIIRADVVHIHPTTQCNLECLHCYSSSGPGQANRLELKFLVEAMSDLAKHGYTHASISGGEPTLYPDINELCVALNDQGYKTSLISNGYNIRVLKDLAETATVDFVAVSFDGMPELHNKIRGKEGAFSKAIRGLKFVSEHFERSGAVVSVSNQSLPMLPELVSVLSKIEISKIHFRPIARTGRAKIQKHTDFVELSEEALLRLFLLTRVFSSKLPSISFECDVGISHLFDELETDSDRLISPLVIKENGQIVPFIYEFCDELSVGRVGEGIDRPILGAKWKETVECVAGLCAAKVASEYYSELATFVSETFVPQLQKQKSYRQ